MLPIADRQICVRDVHKQQWGVARFTTSFGVMCLLLGIAGCGSNATVQGRQESRLQELLTEGDFVGTIIRGDISISYHCPEDLEVQARRTAELVARQLLRVQEKTGFVSSFRHVNLYLKQVDQLDWRAKHLRFLNDTVHVILYVERGDTSYDAIITRNMLFPAVYIHELVELSLCRHGLLGDSRGKTFLGFAKEEYHYTRWFREGFSEYAVFLAYKVMARDPELSMKTIPIYMIQRGMRDHPYSCLAKVGADLFTWHIYFEGPIDLEEGVQVKGEHVPKSMLDYYNASLGLFLYIEDKYGQEAIKKIILNINQQANIDGAYLKKLFNTTLNTDIVKVVEDFRFTRLGMYMLPFCPGIGEHLGFKIKEGLWVKLVGPDSPAERAGIRKDDAVISLEGKRTVTNWDFESALFKHMQKDSVTIGVWRKGVGKMTVRLQLAH